MKSESEVAHSCPTLATPWTAAHQALPSMGFSKQKYWSGVPLPSPLITLLLIKLLTMCKIINLFRNKSLEDNLPFKMDDIEKSRLI